MRMVPPHPSGFTNSDAERRVFWLLHATDLGDWARCFHSLNISEHDYKIVGELDFVVLSRHGLLVLEVKGGGVALDGHGIWKFSDRFGREHRKSEGPFQQARSGMFSLRSRLATELGEHTIEQVPFGYGVIFPDCAFHERSVEWSDEMILDADGMREASDVHAYLERLFRYWRAKSHASALKVATDTLHAIATVIRPRFDRVPSLRHRADQLDAAMERLTEEQFSRLDVIEDNPRILCSGGAGTGKTFLAAEIARRHAALGKRVLIACSGRVLAAFLKSRLPDERITVVPADESVSLTGQFDVLVIDEGQDLLNFECLDPLDRLLHGGLREGVWRAFFDANKQTGLLGRFDADTVELLKSYGAVPVALRMNCRNTRQITTHTKLLTAADLGVPSAGEGPAVDTAYYTSIEEQTALVGERLSHLVSKGVPHGDITILSMGPIEQSCVARLNEYARGRIRRIDEGVARGWPCKETTVGLVPQFKGLENRFVLLTDVERLDDSERDVNMLYVAMSRARAGLWMAVNRRLEPHLERIAHANFERVAKDLQTRAPSETRT